MTGGNEVAGVPVCVRSDIADPIERLLAVREETRKSKAQAEKMGLDLLKNLFDVPPPLAVMCLCPVSIPADGAGLNFTGVSYNGVMWVSMVSCRSMVPDPGAFLACMREAWGELLAAATKGRPARGRAARPRRAKPWRNRRRPRGSPGPRSTLSPATT